MSAVPKQRIELPFGELDDPFMRMLTPEALKIAYPYNKEEEAFLRETLGWDNTLERMNLVVIGAGPLLYLDLAMRNRQHYVAVDPLVSSYVDAGMADMLRRSGRVHIIQDTFEKLERSALPDRSNIYVFPFNVLAYIDSPEELLARQIKPGDLVFISTWGRDRRALELRSSYVNHIDPDGQLGQAKVYDLDRCAISRLDCVFPLSSRHGEICETRVLCAW